MRETAEERETARKIFVSFELTFEISRLLPKTFFLITPGNYPSVRHT